MGLFEGASGGTLALLIVCLAIALGFEFVNGFHDTANAVATVIYTKSLKPIVAVTWSGFVNFLGVLLGGTAVAFSIVHLLPVDLLINIGQTAGLLMVLSLLISAILWNLGTWYFGLPSSSSHALIGSILGVGLAASLFSGRGFGSGVNWAKAQEVGLSLLISPLLGFCFAALLLLILKAVIKDQRLFQEPKGDEPPPIWIRAILFLTCTAVSFFHGSNDGQKGVGLIMLILIGILPTQFALNTSFNTEDVGKTLEATRTLKGFVNDPARAADTTPALRDSLDHIETTLTGTTDFKALPDETRKSLRADILRAGDGLNKWEKGPGATLAKDDKDKFKKAKGQVISVTDFVVSWVPLAVALALGGGTMIGWKRIVVTVGEKIGKTHLNYAQGAAAELVAAITIKGFDTIGLPVSTTHILSSGVAGTMAANKSGLQSSTVRNIAIAWILTLPVTAILAGLIFALTAGGQLKDAPPTSTTPATGIVQPVR